MASVKFVDKISKAVEQKMEKGLVEYSSHHGINVNYTEFAFELYDHNDEVAGVLKGFHSYNSIHIVDLWVEASQRGKGYGRALLNELENHFKGKGFNNINTVTCQFQAPDFYKKCGYKAEFVRENLENPKLSLTFFVKFFDEAKNPGRL